MTTLTDEDQQIVKYLRMCPTDSLKRDAANLIERLAMQTGSNDLQADAKLKLPDSEES